MVQGNPPAAIELSIRCDEDIIAARQKVRELAQEMGFSTLGRTRLVAAVSELARNQAVHAGGGVLRAAPSSEGCTGIRVLFEDRGPGIADLELAMGEGFSTVGSLGLGLQGAKRLVDEFAIRTAPGRGTTVEIVKWLQPTATLPGKGEQDENPRR